MYNVALKEVRPIYATKVVSMPGKPKKWGRIKTARQAFFLFRDLKDQTKEHVIALHLNQKNEVLNFEVVSIGTATASLIDPKAVFGMAVVLRAPKTILLHNHPSGDPEPSSEDREITDRLRDAGKILGVELLDHIIVGDGRYYSFTENRESKSR